MGDVLVKWRTAKPEYVEELVRELPKEEMSEPQFRAIMNSSIYGNSFFRTPYQLACQLGLYCVDNNTYIPRFKNDITRNEAKSYMESWIWHYYVPNPYTKSYAKDCKPQRVMLSIIKHLEDHPENRNLASICQEIWGEPFGNLPNLKYAINEYSKAAHVDGNEQITLEPNYKEIMEEALSRNDKRGFFEAMDGLSASKNTEPVKPTCSDVDLMDEEYGYISAIKTKPFLILGGFSGTGKSVEVKLLAFATCPCDGFLNTSETSPGNYLLISVKPNWHDATDITGFRSSVQNKYFVTDFMRFLVKAKMYEDKNVPFFVCLDEMNLAPVEEYFADFLSVIESRKRKADGKIVTDPIVPASVFNERYADDFNIFMEMGLKPANEDWSADDINALGQKEKEEAFVRQDIVDELRREGLTIPQNVVIVGTVNMDDTTNSFSRKVIDRAMTFETIVGNFGEDYFDGDLSFNYLEHPRNGELFISDEVRALEMLDKGRFELSDSEKNDILAFINNINKDMEGTPFKVSHRIMNETILLYHSKKEIYKLMNDGEDFEDGVNFDTDLNTVFDDILMQKVLPRIEGDYEKCNSCLMKLSARCADNDWTKSEDKIEFMLKRFGSDKSGFTSFWN